MVFIVLALGSGRIMNARGEIKLLSALTSKDKKTVEFELQQRLSSGFQLDWRDSHKRSLAHLAVLNERHPEVLRLVLEMGAQAQLLDDQGRSPLHYSIDVNNLEAAKILKSHLSTSDEEDRTLISSALNYCKMGLDEVPNHETCLYISQDFRLD